MLVGFTTSAFKPPRRFVWVIGATILSLALLQTEFGYGLRGDFASQFRAVSGADFWNGAYLGFFVNPLSHLQEFAIHTVIIPITIILLFILHFILIKTYGLAKPYRKDVPVTMVPADHRIMYLRGATLAVAILALAFFFHSPYVAPVTIQSLAQSDPSTIADTLSAEYDRTSDTATYLDSIDPYTFDTRSVFVTGPYQTLTATTTEVASTTMIATLEDAAANGSYQAILAASDPAPDTYVLRFLSDTDTLEDKASSLNFSTAQWGMARDENGGLGLPPGSWWLTPLGALNSAFDLPDNPNGDRIAAEVFACVLLLFISFPYIPYLNRIPELLHLAPFIWREKK